MLYFLMHLFISEPTMEEADNQLDAEQPRVSDDFSYARRDEYITDPNYDTVEDKMYKQRNG